MIQTREQLKQWFKKYLYPTQQQFWDWMDSYWHKNDSIPVGSIGGLQEMVNGVTGGIGDALDAKQNKEDDALVTDSKTVISAINELKALYDSIDFNDGGGSGWNPPEKYEFGEHHFAIKNMYYGGGYYNQALFDENTGIWLYSENENYGGQYLKLGMSSGYAALGSSGNDIFAGTYDITNVLFGGTQVFVANWNVTTLRHYYYGDIFSCDYNGDVQILRQGNTVFGANNYATELKYNGYAAFSAVGNATVIYLKGRSMFESGIHPGGGFNGSDNYYTEIHRFKNSDSSNNEVYPVLHADNFGLSLFAGEMKVLDVGIVSGYNNVPYFVSYLIDNTDHEDIRQKKVLEASTEWTALYINDKKILDFGAGYFGINAWFPTNDGSHEIVNLVNKTSSDISKLEFRTMKQPYASIFMSIDEYNIYMNNMIYAHQDIILSQNTGSSNYSTSPYSLINQLHEIKQRLNALEAIV